ncbi:MAG: hypothetical protein VB042_10485 [Victivallaceae bacterium]|nr:hypothetical protein [Victivallaceae bacterium]
MSIKVSCPKCGQHYDLDEAYENQTVECEKCGKAFIVSEPKTDPSEQSPNTPKSNTQMRKTTNCADCGGIVSFRATRCPHCGAPRRVSTATTLAAAAVFAIGLGFSIIILVNAPSIIQEMFAVQLFIATSILAFHIDGYRAR